MRDEWARSIRELLNLIQENREPEPEPFLMRFETEAEAKAAIRLYQRAPKGNA